MTTLPTPAVVTAKAAFATAETAFLAAKKALAAATKALSDSVKQEEVAQGHVTSHPEDDAAVTALADAQAITAIAQADYDAALTAFTAAEADFTAVKAALKAAEDVEDVIAPLLETMQDGKIKPDFKHDWAETTKKDWKVDWAIN